MKYYDQHLHTYYSPDSIETFENYLKQSDLPVVTTEHLDFYSPEQKIDDVILDYAGYTERIKELNKDYANRLLKGIEVGFTYKNRHRIESYLKGKTFDIILFSIHHNGRENFMQINHDTKDLAMHLDEYYSLMLQGIKLAPYANVLAHFDYGLRGYDDVSISDLKRIEVTLIEILKTIIKQNQALELNTRSMYRFGNAHLYDYIIGLYRSLGGELFTVSSDGHVAEDYQLHFKDAFSLLQKHRVEELVVYQNQRAKRVSISEIKVA